MGIKVKIVLDKEDEKRNFPLPHFRSFYSNLSKDPVYQKYQKENLQIQKILKKKNKFDLILNQLGYRANSHNVSH